MTKEYNTQRAITKHADMMHKIKMHYFGLRLGVEYASQEENSVVNVKFSNKLFQTPAEELKRIQEEYDLWKSNIE